MLSVSCSTACSGSLVPSAEDHMGDTDGAALDLGDVFSMSSCRITVILMHCHIHGIVVADGGHLEIRILVARTPSSKPLATRPSVHVCAAVFHQRMSPSLVAASLKLSPSRPRHFLAKIESIGWLPSQGRAMPTMCRSCLLTPNEEISLSDSTLNFGLPSNRTEKWHLSSERRSCNATTES